MRKNELGRLEMFPIPTIGNGEILIIGESVNIQELQKGQYFISDGAEALHATFNQFGVNQNEFVYSVAIPYIMNKKKHVIPDQFIKNHNRLWDEIKQSGVKYVMPLGTLASQVLLNDKVSTITKLVGNVIQRDGVTIIPNYHPAMLFHNPGEYKVFNKVVETLCKLYKGYQHNPGVTKWEVVDSKEKLIYLIGLIHHHGILAADIETNSLTVWNAEIWVMGITMWKNHSYVIPREMFKKYPGLISELLSTGKWIWHNGKYDISVLHWNGFNEAKIDEDTILLHYCLNESNGTHSLGACSTIYLGADEYKSKMNAEFANINTEQDYIKYKYDLIERVAVDSDYTFQLYNIFKKMVYKDENLIRLYEKILIQATNFLTEVQKRGVKIDIPYLKERIPHYEQKIDDLVKQIEIAAGPYWNKEQYMREKNAKSASDKFKPSSTKQVSWLVWDKLKLRPTIRTKVGATGAEVLESIPNAPQVITLILDLRKVQKEYSTYVKNYIKKVDKNDIMHCTFNLHTTATGRLSCTDENIQNVPSRGRQGKELRRAFIPRGKDRILMEVDYSGAELRVLAFMAQDEKMMNAVMYGDLHSEVAESIFGPNFTKEERGLAKTINFGIAYGRSGKAIEDAFDLSKGEGDAMIKKWAETYPDAWKYLEGCTESVRLGKALETPFGRYRRFGLVSKKSLGSLSNEAKNFRIQSISSDNTLMAAMNVDPLLNNIYDAKIINLIHDSILIDLPSDPKIVQSVAKILVKEMIDVPKKYYNCNVEFKCDVDIGHHWGEVKGLDYETMIIDNMPYEKWLERK